MSIHTSANAADWKKTEVFGPGVVNSSQKLPLVTGCNPGCVLEDTKPFVSEGQRALRGLPDGYVAEASSGDIVESLYDRPTDRYAHGILGDAIEAGRLIARLADGSALYAELLESAVFEDRTPRIVDLDGDGRSEIVTILSSRTEGASIAVFGIRNRKLRLLSQTPYIGRFNRWLNIAAIADLTGDGRQEIASVWTPHIGGTLKVWSWKWGRLRLVDERFGYSNHQIGSREQRLSAVADFDGDGKLDLALPNKNRQSLELMSIAKGKLRTLASIPLPARIDKAIAVSGDKPSVLTLGLDDGSVFAVHR